MPKRVILDTDIGTDVDDTLALTLILGSPELALEGVTVVYGDVSVRGRIAEKLLRLRGITDVPIRLGAAQTLNPIRGGGWAGLEGLGLLSEDDPEFVPSPESASDFIIRTAMENPGEIHLVCIAPLTNAALTLRKEPSLAQYLASLTIMGGAVRGPGHFDLPYWEHNIGADTDASQIVFTSGAPITLVPLDVTTRVYYRAELAARMREKRSPYYDAVALQIEQYPYVRAYGASHAHDPLAVATLIDPTLVTLETVHVDIETEGRLTMGATLVRAPNFTAPANARVALDVDPERAEAFLVERWLRES
jgi:purine nucleosidase